MVRRDFNGVVDRIVRDDVTHARSTVWPATQYDGTSDAAAPLSEAELLDFLKRSLAGEPFPVSAPRDRSVTGDAPLSSRVRRILQAENENQRAAPALADPVESPFSVEITSPIAPLHPGLAAAPGPIEVDLPPLHAMPSRPWERAGVSAAFVLFLTLGAAYIPSLFAAPPLYEAQARLQVQGLARTTPGFLQAESQRLSSPALLAQVVTKLKLDGNDEFTGGEATSYSVVKDLLTDSGAAADRFSRAQRTLRQRLSITPDAQSGSVALTVQSGDPKTAARIANSLADAAVRDAAAKPAVAVPSAADLALAEERKRYDAASAALATFKTGAGEDKIAAASALMAQRESLDTQLAAAERAAQAAAIRLTAAKSVKMSDVLDGAISPDLGSPAALEDLRNRYAAARTTVGQLSTQLGPRHPRLLAAQSVVDGLSASITAELRKMVSTADADARSTASQAKLLKERRAGIDRQPSDVDLDAFGKLQADAETARQAYETALTAAQDVQPDVKAAAPLSLVAPAVPATAPLDDNRLWRTAMAALSGFGIAMVLVGLRWLMASRPRQASFDEEAFDLEMVDLMSVVREEVAPARGHLDQPVQRFDADIAVANDRRTALPEPVQPEAGTALTAIIDDVASLRERVAHYAMRRQAAGR